MTIQINTDKTLSGNQKQKDFLASEITKALKIYEPHITRIEVHLKDENGKKEGLNDIKCILEVRIEGRQPVAVTSQADTVEFAVSDATDKVKTALKTIFGRIQNF
ncbi:MAG: putative component of type VI protein secretion system [Crocinitomicaceae bacterium]|jgi:predicted component of type VI protein secretion system